MRDICPLPRGSNGVLVWLHGSKRNHLYCFKVQQIRAFQLTITVRNWFRRENEAGTYHHYDAVHCILSSEKP